MNDHNKQWNQLLTAWRNQRLPHALVLVGPGHEALPEFAVRFMQLILCQSKQDEPCLHCLECRMAQQREHPDTVWIKPEKSGGMIKIDQIRDLQQSVYLTAQRAGYRIILIEGADRMNTASANALLKILEEPPVQTIFLLLAQQLSTMLPTVLSRCQVLRFASHQESWGQLLKLGENYSQDSEQATVLKQSDALLNDLVALIDGKKHPCALAALWAQYDLNALLWFLYLVCAQVQYLHTGAIKEKNQMSPQFLSLWNLLNPLLIFTQIDKINTLLRKLSHNMNINQTLALEDLLFSFIA